MIVRPYSDADFTAVVELFAASIHGLTREHYDSVQRDAWAPPEPEWDSWRERLGEYRTFVAEDEGRIVGFLSYEMNGHVDLLYVAPDATRRGVASMLLARAEEVLTENGVDEAFTEASLVALPFFQRRGFDVVEEQTVERRGVSLGRWAMRKQLRKHGRAE